jgi:anti-sigma B factor antagonist
MRCGGGRGITVCACAPPWAENVVRCSATGGRAMPSNTLGLVQRDDVTIVRIGGNRLVERSHVDEIGQDLLRLVDDVGRSRLLLDFANVESISVAILPTLIALRQRLLARHGGLALCSLQFSVRELVTFAGLELPLNVHDTERDALLSLGKEDNHGRAPRPQSRVSI